MTTAMRVSLTPALKRDAVPDDAAALLDPHGPIALIGGAGGSDGLAVPVKADALSLFGPRGACLIAPDGPLWVSDTGHHRLLGWARMPAHEHAAADWVIGQRDFTREGRNAKGLAAATTFNVPTGITPCGDGLAVADAWNHRVLIWNSVPHCSYTPPDIVLGQADFAAVESNRGAEAPSAATPLLALWCVFGWGHARGGGCRQPSRIDLESACPRATAKPPIWCWGSASSPAATKTAATSRAPPACAGRMA